MNSLAGGGQKRNRQELERGEGGEEKAREMAGRLKITVYCKRERWTGLRDGERCKG